MMYLALNLVKHVTTRIVKYQEGRYIVVSSEVVPGWHTRHKGGMSLAVKVIIVK